MSCNNNTSGGLSAKWPGSASFSSGSGDTPFGIYDSDLDFQHDAPLVANYVARRLGYPSIDIELNACQLFTCFEEAVTEYSAQVNQFNIRNNLYNLVGNERTYEKVNDSSSLDLNGKWVEGSNLNQVIQISDQYGSEALVGGNIALRSASISLEVGQQSYDLKELFENTLHSGSKIEVRKVFHDGIPAVSRFFDPYAVSAMGTLNLIDEFGFASFSPTAQFVLMPLFEDILRMQQIEFNDQIRRSFYSFHIVDNVIKIFPIPTTTQSIKKVWIQYTLEDDRYEGSSTGNIRIKGDDNSGVSNVIGDYSNIGYDFMKYAAINSVGKQWIWRYTLALAKELLGAVREKYATIPIAGQDSISLDGAALRAEALQDKETLFNQLRQTLEELSKPKQMEYKAAEAEQVQKMLGKVPLPFYIG
jgi:hypothetical protein